MQQQAAQSESRLILPGSYAMADRDFGSWPTINRPLELPSQGAPSVFVRNDIVTFSSIAEAEADLRDMRVSKDVGDTLARVYPGYRWLVNAQFDQGIVDLRCGQVHGLFGATIHLRRYYSASSFKRTVIGFGGELLERARLSRTRARNDELLTTKRDLRGQILLETH